MQALIKQSKRKDYYKILGVPRCATSVVSTLKKVLCRNANKRQIQKAYRELAQQWHPDNFSDEQEKKKAEAKFIDIASAKEVLTDPGALVLLTSKSIAFLCYREERKVRPWRGSA